METIYRMITSFLVVFLEREGERQGKREGEKHRCLLYTPQLGTRQNWESTSELWLCKTKPNQLSHMGQGMITSFLIPHKNS